MPPREPSATPSPAGDASRREVLLVTRAPAIRAAVAAALASIGGASLAVVDGLAAVESIAAARASEPASPLVVLDAVSRPDVLPDRPPSFPFAVIGDGNLTALRAFELGALDCLTLPIDRARLADVLRRAAGAPAARPLVRDAGGRELHVDPAAVDWVERVRGGTVIHAGGDAHETTETIEGLERALVGCRLLRVQGSLAVNQDRVSCLELGPGGAARVVLDNGLVVPIEPDLGPAVHAALGG